MRRLISLGGAFMLAMAATAAALPADDQGDYNGAVRGDPRPGSAIWFDVERTDSGARRVTHFSGSGLDFTCENGDADDTSAVFLLRSFRVRRDRTFGGRADAVIGGFDPPARLRGRLRRGGRASGVLRVHGELDPEGRDGVQCDTGLLEWWARR